MYQSALIQKKIDELTEEDEDTPLTHSNVVGFTIPTEEDYEEEEDEDD